MNEEKEHYKLYKVDRNWVAALVVVGSAGILGFSQPVSVHADMVTPNTAVRASSSSVKETQSSAAAVTSKKKISVVSESSVSSANQRGQASSTSSKTDSASSVANQATSGAATSSSTSQVKTSLTTRKVMKRAATSTNISSANDTTGVNDYDSATSVANSEKAHVPTAGEKLADTYTFIPKYNGSGKTTVTALGKTIDSSAYGDNKVAIDVNQSTKGKTGFLYTNVGYDDSGSSVDMKIIYTNWGRLSTAGTPAITNTNGKIEPLLAGIGWVDSEYEFFAHGTEKPDKVSGLLTLTDIDGQQTVSLNETTWDKVDQVLIPTGDDPLTNKTDNWLREVTQDGYHTYVAPAKSSSRNAEYAMLTFTYTNQSSLEFRFSNGRSTTPGMGNWGVNYIAQKPMATETVAPTLKVSNDNTNFNTDNVLPAGKTSYTYQVNQLIPDEWAQFYYPNVVFEGTLPTGETLQSFKVTNSDGEDVTNQFTNQSSGTNLKLNVNANELQSADFYGKTYQLLLTVGAPKATDDVQNLKFTVATTIDDVKKSSGTVTTQVPANHYLTTHYYIEGTTQSLAPDKVQLVLPNTSFTAPDQAITGYTVDKTASQNVSGTFGDQNESSIYYYQADPEQVTVHYYLQGTTQSLKPDTTSEGKYAQTYHVTAPEITGYQLSKSSNASGTYSISNSDVVFEYAPLAEQVTVHYYLQGTTQSLKPDMTLTGKYVQDYQAMAPGITGYQLNKSSNVSGTYDISNSDAVFEYAPLAEQVTVHYYLQGTTRKLKSDTVLTGKYAQAYQITAPEITGYLLNKSVNATGIYNVINSDSIFEYEKKNIYIKVNFFTLDGLFLDSKVINGKYLSTYKIVPRTFTDQSLILKKVDGQLVGRFPANNQIINVYYALWHQKTVINSDGSNALLTLNGNDQVIEIEQQHIDGSETIINIGEDFKSAVVKNTDLNLKLNLSKKITIKKGGAAVIIPGANSLKYWVKYLENGTIVINTLGNSSDKDQSSYDNISVCKNGEVSTSTRKKIKAGWLTTYKVNDDIISQKLALKNYGIITTQVEHMERILVITLKNKKEVNINFGKNYRINNNYEVWVNNEGLIYVKELFVPVIEEKKMIKKTRVQNVNTDQKEIRNTRIQNGNTEKNGNLVDNLRQKNLSKKKLLLPQTNEMSNEGLPPIGFLGLLGCWILIFIEKKKWKY